jgi:prepilin-type N-terminal cleavage/methylation domain-containing protein
MRIKKCNAAFTLLEMLVVVSVIAILVTIVISVASRLDTQGKINSTKGTMALLDAALSEFEDYGFTYAAGSQYANAYLKFPIDCNDRGVFNDKSQVEAALTVAMGHTVTINNSANDPNYFSTEAMYFLLSQVPQCRQALEKIDKKCVVRDNETGIIRMQSEDYPLMYITDGWGRPLGYKYYYFTSGTNIDTRTIKTFPVLTSAGPDGDFNTADDIKSR